MRPYSHSVAGKRATEYTDNENSDALYEQRQLRDQRHNGARLHLLDSFIACGALTVVITRIGLEVTGYPKISGTTWHFAHAFWGGLLLAVGQLLSMLAPRRYGVLAAIFGGTGFGLFIDEVGKLTTNNSDYFFKLSGSLMYISFIVLWLAARYWVTRSAKLPFFSSLSWPHKKWVKILILCCMGAQVSANALVLSEALFDFLAVSNVKDPPFSGAWYDHAMIYVVAVYSLWLIILGAFVVRQKFSVVSAAFLRTTGYTALLSVYPLMMTSFPVTTSISTAVNILIMILLSDSKNFEVFFFSYWKWLQPRGAKHK